MNIRIKKLEKTECNIVVEMFNKYRIFYKQPSDDHLAENYLKERIESNQAPIFIAYSVKLNLIFGFILLYLKYLFVPVKRNWHMADLFAKSEFRKQRIGNILLIEAMNFTIEKDAVFVFLNTTTDNCTAQIVNNQFGFEKYKTTPRYFYYHYKLKR